VCVCVCVCVCVYCVTTHCPHTQWNASYNPHGKDRKAQAVVNGYAKRMQAKIKLARST
jgi:hypothetical protein